MREMEETQSNVMRTLGCTHADLYRNGAGVLSLHRRFSLS